MCFVICWLIKLDMSCLEDRILREVAPCSSVVTFRRIVVFHSNVIAHCFIQYRWDYYYYYYYYGGREKCAQGFGGET